MQFIYFLLQYYFMIVPSIFIFFIYLPQIILCSFDFIDSLTVPSQLFQDFDQCGYHSYPIIQLNNGTVLLWKYQHINFPTTQFTACFKYSDEVQQKKRYIANLPSQMGSTNPYILSKDHITELQGIKNWKPTIGQGQYIYDIYISPNIIAVYVKGITKNQIDIFKTDDLSIMTKLTLDLGVNFEMFVDNFNNVVLFNFVSNQVQVFYGYSSNYTNKKVTFIPNIVGRQSYYANIGAYRSGQITSKLMLYYSSTTKNSKISLQIQYKLPQIQYNQQTEQYQAIGETLEATFSSTQQFQTNLIHIDCQQYTVVYNTSNGCFYYDGDCILERKQFYGAICFKQKHFLQKYRNKIKLVVTSQNPNNPNQIQIQIYEHSSKIAQIIIIVVLSIILITIILIILYIIARCKGIPFKQFITCRCNSKKIKKQKLEQEQKYQTMLDE